MLDKTVQTLAEAVSEIPDGATVLVGGFGGSGAPIALLEALLEQGATDLVVVSNNAGSGTEGLNALVGAGRVRKLICSYPKSADKSQPLAAAFEQMYRAGKVELECIPQGTMVERMRAAGAGLGPFFCPTGYGTLLAEGKETRVIDGVGYVLEQPIRADYALVKADLGDRWGNLTYRLAGRNFAPVMCTAARHAIAQVREIVPLGSIPPEQVMTPAIFVQKVVCHAS
ncbi:MAG: 3-oxoacid CoA-transferase subunit A [Comamonadaceae bacterium]|nr:3-oxoacid CoA-transferase subunit A [Comamonadaceae bacterium]